MDLVVGEMVGHFAQQIGMNPSEGRTKIYRVMVFNATFNNTSAIMWQSVFLVEETGEPGENHQPAVSH